MMFRERRESLEQFEYWSPIVTTRAISRGENLRSDFGNLPEWMSQQRATDLQPTLAES
jgi:hypothetical protein